MVEVVSFFSFFLFFLFCFLIHAEECLEVVSFFWGQSTTYICIKHPSHSEVVSYLSYRHLNEDLVYFFPSGFYGHTVNLSVDFPLLIACYKKNHMRPIWF